MSESIDQKNAKVAEIDVGALQSLAIRLFNKVSNKTTKLINNVDPELFMKGRNQTYPFELKDPVFISSIGVQVEDYTEYNEMEFRWTSIRGGGETIGKARLRDSTFTIPVNDIVANFSIRPPTKYFTNPKLKGVVVHGLTNTDFSSVCGKIGRLNRLKEDVIADCDKRY